MASTSEDFDRLLAATQGTVVILSDQLRALREARRTQPNAEAADIAKRIYRERRTRERYLDAALLGEPAWDILLDLYVARIEGRSISASSACLAAAVPATTALRWLKRLERDNLIRRRAASDKRSTFIEITDTAFDRLTALFARLATVGEDR